MCTPIYVCMLSSALTFLIVCLFVCVCVYLCSRVFLCVYTSFYDPFPNALCKDKAPVCKPHSSALR